MIYTDSFERGRRAGGTVTDLSFNCLLDIFMQVTAQTFGLPQNPYCTVQVKTASKIENPILFTILKRLIKTVFRLLKVQQVS